ncbi:MAG: plasmid recombination protein [Bacilli bacterium]
MTFSRTRYKFFAERYGEENVIAAVVHNDETTPHMHLNLMPVTKGGRLCSKQLFDKPRVTTITNGFLRSESERNTA